MSSVFNKLQSGMGKKDLLSLSHMGGRDEDWLATHTGPAAMSLIVYWWLVKKKNL